MRQLAEVMPDPEQDFIIRAVFLALPKGAPQAGLIGDDIAVAEGSMVIEPALIGLGHRTSRLGIVVIDDGRVVRDTASVDDPVLGGPIVVVDVDLLELLRRRKLLLDDLVFKELDRLFVFEVLAFRFLRKKGL